MPSHQRIEKRERLLDYAQKGILTTRQLKRSMSVRNKNDNELYAILAANMDRVTNLDPNRENGDTLSSSNLEGGISKDLLGIKSFNLNQTDLDSHKNINLQINNSQMRQQQHHTGSHERMQDTTS